MASVPVLIIINGLPSSGKTTLAERLAAEIRLPHFSRDGIFETIYDALNCDTNGMPAALGSASFALLYATAGVLLDAGQSLIIEGFFGRPDLRTAELLQLRRAHAHEPFQIICTADGNVLWRRFLARMGSAERHSGHRDREWLNENEARLLRGELAPLTLGGQTVAYDTTTPDSVSYALLVQRVRAALA